MITTKQVWRVITTVVLAALVYLLMPYFLNKAPINQTLANGATLEWGDCWFATRWWRPVYCGWFTTAAATDDSYQLPVVYIPYVGWDREPDPILYLNGGPGSSAYLDKENIGYWWQWIDDVSARRDWLIYEQRGTGISPTALTCVDLYPLYRQSLTERSYQADYLLSVQQQLVDCFADVIAAGYQIDFLNTHYNAKDALDLMQTLVLDRPIVQWNLYGISYGSRLALEIMRLQPQNLRSVVLDGVYPPQVNGFLSWPKIAEDTFARLEAWCMDNASCRNENEFFMSRLEQLLPRLRNDPRSIELTLAGGDTLDFVINDINFYNMIISGMYSWDLAIQVPQLIDDVYAGNITDRVEIFASYYVDWILDTSFSDVVYFMVDCHDSGYYSENDMYSAIQRVPLLADMYSEWVKYDTCPKVPGLRAGNDFRMPVSSDVPTLLLSGELDPVTPPMWGRMAADTLTAGRHRVLRGIGHGVAYSSVCGQDLIRAFWSDPLAESVNCSAWEEHPGYQ